MKHCGSVPPDVQDFFRRELDGTAEVNRTK
jgi:hypothetical protein